LAAYGEDDPPDPQKEYAANMKKMHEMADDVVLSVRIQAIGLAALGAAAVLAAGAMVVRK
jgi:hypothetical protein